MFAMMRNFGSRLGGDVSAKSHNRHDVTWSSPGQQGPADTDPTPNTEENGGSLAPTTSPGSSPLSLSLAVPLHCGRVHLFSG